MLVVWVLLFTVSSCLQYIPLLQLWNHLDSNITNWTRSNATFTDDSPFDQVELPFSFLFYDHRQTHVWISPNGFLSFAPGVPCDCCYNGANCDVETHAYQALAGPYLADLNPLQSNQSSIEFGWNDQYFVTKWKHIFIYGYSDRFLDFAILLSRDGSILFHYDRILLPLPTGYTQGNSFVGIRPFYYQGNYTRRSPIVSSNQDVWGTKMDGNYARYEQLYTIQDGLNSTAPNQRTLLHFCLMPTEFCIYPYLVDSSPVMITASFSILSCGDPTNLQFRCMFDNYTAAATLQDHSFTCLKPAFVPSNSTIEFQIAVFSGNDWTPIETVSPLFLMVQTSASIQPVCDAQQQTCSLCGTCGNSTLCLGVDDQLFGRDIHDCPAGELMDRAGVCCVPSEMDCKGSCFGAYTEALDSTGSYPVCCLNSTVDCSGVCGGTAVLDLCGVCSGGFTGHVANSDMDCTGVCFGAVVTDCEIHMITSSLEIPLIFRVDMDETSISTLIFINNTTPFFGKLDTYPLIYNRSPPSVYYSLFLMNETDADLIPVDPNNFIFPGYAKLAIRISASIQALVYSPREYERSIKEKELEFVFGSMRSSHNTTQHFNFTLSFITRGCHVIKNTRSCNLLPGCFGCPLNVESYQHSNYFAKSYALDAREYMYMETTSTHYFTCVDVDSTINSLGMCKQVVEEIEKSPWVLTRTNFLSVLSNYYLYIVYVILVILAGIVIHDFVNMLKMRRFENELWLLYVNDYAEYRSIMTSIQEETEE